MNKYTVFILINAPGALQFTIPESEICQLPMKDKMWSNIQNFSVVKPFLIAFSHLSPIKSGRWRLLERGCLLE